MLTLWSWRASEPYEALESWVSPQFKPLAYSIILLRPDGCPSLPPPPRCSSHLLTVDRPLRLLGRSLRPSTAPHPPSFLRTWAEPVVDVQGIQGEHKFEPVSQLADIIRARKLFAYGELRDYWHVPSPPRRRFPFETTGI